MVNRKTPILVALDGGSGSGKSSLAWLIAEQLDVALIQSDDFFAAEISDAEWDARTPEARATDVIDWRRLRAEVLEPLRAGKPAQWHAFDFAAGVRPNGTYGMRTDFVAREPRAVIVLEGAYATRPELSDLIDYSVLLDVPVAVRHERLVTREDKHFLAAWHARWDAAEEYYFTYVRPKSCFDLVVTTEWLIDYHDRIKVAVMQTSERDTTMTTAVSYAYVNAGDNRPSLTEQFNACRAYSSARGYTIFGEFNDIDESDQPALTAAVEAIHDAVASQGVTTILVYRPSAWALERLNRLGARIEDVSATGSEQRSV
jgi:uridine kinase